ncbi:hypothetical protein OEZ86_012142 [Tetradesmus obliquus]|nr:hypothetical protein OEZ86_012142 [Tetradesmus obliquus]
MWQTLDATRRGSIARFINHSCTPNCEARSWMVGSSGSSSSSRHVVICAARDIAPGEELTYDYNLSSPVSQAGSAALLPAAAAAAGLELLPCRCGSSNCRRYL